MNRKKILTQIYRANLLEERVEFSNATLENLKLDGLVAIKDGNIVLEERGRAEIKVVFTGGTYDLLHLGHLKTLEEAKSHGDVLVVVVARDKTVKERKRVPIFTENERLIMLRALQIVDVAILGDETDHLKTVEAVKPDIIAIGADQHYDTKALEAKIEERGIKGVEVIRLKSDHDGLSTTMLIEKIKERYC